MWTNILHYWQLFLGLGTTAVVLVALVIIFPAFGPALTALLTPVFRAIGKILGDWLDDIREGARINLSTFPGLVFTGTLVVGSVLFGHWYFEPDTCKAMLADLHKNYVFTARPKQQKPLISNFNPLNWF